MCKEVLFLLKHKTVGNINEKCAKSSENVESHEAKCSTTPLFTLRPVFATKVKLYTTSILAELYKRQRNVEFLDNHVKAKEHYEKALAIAGKIGDREAEAICHADLGGIFESLGEHAKAKEHYEKALAIAGKIGHRRTEAKCYTDLGGIFETLGEHAKAKEYCEKALSIAGKIGNRKGEAACYAALGIIFLNLGEYVKAKEHCEKALSIAGKIGDRETEARCYVTLGIIFQNLSENVKAKEYCEKALSIAGKIGNRKGEAACYAALGIIFLNLGEYVKAKEHCEKALAIAGKIGDRRIEAKCYSRLGCISLRLDEHVKAKEYYEKGLAIAGKTGERRTEAECYSGIGILSLSLGEHVKAKEHCEKALAIAEKIGDRETEALCHGKLGKIFLYLSEYVKAKECFEKDLECSRKHGIKEDESLCCLLLSICMFKLGNICEGKSNIFASINEREILRGLQVQDKYKISYFDHVVSYYRVASHLLSKSSFLHEAFYLEEYGRARALADLMAAQYSVQNEIPVTPQRWDDIESIVKKECNCTCLYISYCKQWITFWVLKAESPLLFRQINVNDFFVGKGSVSRVADLLSREIYREVLCLAPEQCEDRSWLPSDTYSEYGRERPLEEDDEDQSQQPERTPAFVYKMIIAPVADLLDKPEIIIVPDRLFYKVPFAALEEESRKCLSESFRIHIVPSLTTLKLIQDSPADYHSQTGVLVVGDPDVGEVLYNRILRRISRLPFASEEAKMIGKLFGTEPLVGKQATKQAVLQNIHSVSLIHFACHGNAERGEIVLAPPPLTDRRPQEEDYLLTMENISQVQLRAKLVVLSCCHSAKGHISAEGVVGIARAFLGSGARSVLAALWAIEDEATEQFMSRFYENLVRGNSASESLQQAMNWMRENGFAKITQWAPFMLIGDNVTLDVHKLRLTEGQ